MSCPDLKLDETLRFAFWDRIKVPSQPTHQDRKVAFNPVSAISNVILKQSHYIETSIITTVPVSERFDAVTPYQVFFHDVLIPVSDERQVIRFSQVRLELEMLTIFCSRKLSKGWMGDYMSARDRLIDRIDYSNKFETSRVKVAVLDTGVDWNDSYIRGAKDRIMEWKNWADDREGQDSQQQVHDDAGHGTHVTALLLKTAPEAKVYISRVADQNGSMIVAERIAEVSLLILSSVNFSFNGWNAGVQLASPFTLLRFAQFLIPQF
jgi:subtilisin family serine protease